MPGPRMRNPETGEVVEWTGSEWVLVNQGVPEKGPEAEQLKNIQAAADTARYVMGQTERFRNALEREGEGGQFEAQGLGPLNWSAMNPVFGMASSPAEKEMQSAFEIMRTRIRQPGSGATSDMEFKAYGRAVPDVFKTRDQNRLILDQFEEQAARDLARAEAADAWVRRFGSFAGFEADWNRRIAARRDEIAPSVRRPLASPTQPSPDSLADQRMQQAWNARFTGSPEASQRAFAQWIISPEGRRVRQQMVDGYATMAAVGGQRRGGAGAGSAPRSGPIKISREELGYAD